MKGTFPIPNIFSTIEGFRFAFSSSLDGDMKNPKNRQNFMTMQGLGMIPLITMRQDHGVNVRDVTHANASVDLSGVDGLVAKVGEGGTGSFLGVKVADCVPIFAVDPRSKIFGVAHAGWKGVLSKIGSSLLTEMIRLGAEKTRIRIFIGPHICSSCYSIEKDRAKLFQKAYPAPVVRVIGEKYFLDLARAIRLDFLSEGIPEDRMEASEICSSCGRWPSFSYRRSRGNLDGVMMGVVGFLKI